MAGGSHQQVVAMTRICITGGPRTGKTTLARDMLQTPHETLTPGQRSMAKGVETVHREVELWLAEHGMETEYR